MFYVLHYKNETTMKKLIIILFLLSINHFSNAQGVEEYKKYHQKGREFAKNKQFNKAIQEYNKAIAKMPYYSAIFYDRGLAQLSLKNYHEARLNFSTAIQKRPYHIDSYLQRGIALFYLQDYDLAKADFEKVLKDESNHAIALSYQQKVEQAQNQIALEQARIDNQNRYYEESLNTQRRSERRFRRNQIIWGTVIPLAIWTSAILIW